MIIWLKRHRKALFIFSLLLVLFVTNAFHEKYPDEFDSIVGGRYITEGKLPYRVVSTSSTRSVCHGGGSAVVCRPVVCKIPYRLGNRVICVACRFLICCFPVGFPREFVLLCSAFVRHWAFGHVFLGNMLLADTLAGYFILPAFSLLFLKDYYKEKFEAKDLMIVGWFAFLSWFTSMTYIFIVAAISAYALYLYGDKYKQKFTAKLFTGGAILAAPYILLHYICLSPSYSGLLLGKRGL